LRLEKATKRYFDSIPSFQLDTAAVFAFSILEALNKKLDCTKYIANFRNTAIVGQALEAEYT
jgi:hypothetical protein